MREVNTPRSRFLLCELSKRCGSFGSPTSSGTFSLRLGMYCLQVGRGLVFRVQIWVLTHFLAVWQRGAVFIGVFSVHAAPTENLVLCGSQLEYAAQKLPAVRRFHHKRRPRRWPWPGRSIRNGSFDSCRSLRRRWSGRAVRTASSWRIAAPLTPRTSEGVGFSTWCWAKSSRPIRYMVSSWPRRNPVGYGVGGPPDGGLNARQASSYFTNSVGSPTAKTRPDGG